MLESLEVIIIFQNSVYGTKFSFPQKKKKEVTMPREKLTSCEYVRFHYKYHKKCYQLISNMAACCVILCWEI